MRTFDRMHVGVVGISTEGLDAVLFFANKGVQVTCFDRRNIGSLAKAVSSCVSFPNVSWSTGQSYLSSLRMCDMVVRSPGVHPRLPELLDYKSRGGEITSPTELFFEFCRAPIIGVTGTKGKGTTVSLIGEMLNHKGDRVHIGGNIGVPLLSMVERIELTDRVVYELSSFQLEDMTRSPHIAVVLRITQDHLKNFDPLASNYHDTRESYIAAKLPIVRFQTARDSVIVNADDPVSSAFSNSSQGVRYAFGHDSNVHAYIDNEHVFLQVDGKKELITTHAEMQIPGLHNLENVAAAALAAHISGVSVESIRTIAHTFKGLPHRLETVGKVRGRTFINDSFSTTPETTIAAVRSFASPMNLILGGSDKQSDYREMANEITKQQIPSCILIGAMGPVIGNALHEAGYAGIMKSAKTLKEAVRVSYELSTEGDIVMLSPACASFDMFENYKIRGLEFCKEVHDLETQT